MIDIERLHSVIENEDTRRCVGNTFANMVLLLQSIVDGKEAFNRPTQYLLIGHDNDFIKRSFEDAANALFLDDNSVSLSRASVNVYKVYVDGSLVGYVDIKRSTDKIHGLRYDNIFVDHFASEKLTEEQINELSICLNNTYEKGIKWQHQV